MSAVLESPHRHAVTAQEYLRMGEAGVFAPDARLELIDGEIVAMAPIGSPHASVVRSLNKIFVRLAGDDALVSVQDPLIIGDRSVPQPDLALLKPRVDGYSKAHPTASDVFLVVEVADTTLEYDLGTKVPLYARAGVAEAWVVDVQARAIRVFREPSSSGYLTSFAVAVGASVHSAALPNVVVELGALFPG